MFADIVNALIAGGVVTTVATLGYKLHVDAVNTERRRADDHKEAAKLWRDLALERERQVATLLAR